MKIALVAEWLDVSRGGAETSIMQFIDQLIDRRIEVTLLTRSVLPERPNLSVRTFNPTGLTRSARTARFLDQAGRQIPQIGCHLAHAFIPCYSADIYQPRGGAVAETIERTAASRTNPITRWAKRKVAKLNARQQRLLRMERFWLTGPTPPTVIAISDYVRRQFLNHYNCPPSQIRCIRNGVALPDVPPSRRCEIRHKTRRELGVDQEALLLLQIAHNFKLKGVSRTIEAASLASQKQQPAITTVIVGKGDVRSISGSARRAITKNRVVFTGPSRRIADFLYAADVLIHPTYYDPCSRVVLEAIAAGLPVIGTRFDGACEVIQNDRHGFVVDSPDDVRALADRIVSLCDPQVRQTLRSNIIELEEAVSMSRHASEICALYETLVK